jgi:hypothetical protein
VSDKEMEIIPIFSMIFRVNIIRRKCKGSSFENESQEGDPEEIG